MAFPPKNIKPFILLLALSLLAPADAARRRATWRARGIFPESAASPAA